jgi:hypothetical protein
VLSANLSDVTGAIHAAELDSDGAYISALTQTGLTVFSNWYQTFNQNLYWFAIGI